MHTDTHRVRNQILCSEMKRIWIFLLCFFLVLDLNAARKGDGIDDTVVAGSSITSPANYTWCMWYQNASAPGTVEVDQPLNFSNTNADTSFGFSWDHHNSTFTQAAFHREAGGTFQAAQLTSILSFDTWYHICGTYDGTDLKSWLDGTNEATTPAAELGATAPTPSALAGRAGTAAFDDGTIAETALWNVALTSDEIGALSGGQAVSMTRPGSLVLYWPLWGVASLEPDLSGNANNGIVTGATVADHAPVGPYKVR